MYFSTTNLETLTIIKMQCPICKKMSNIKISRENNFISLFIIFNFWYFGKMIGTCGNCHENIQLKTNETYELLDSIDISINQSNIMKNVLFNLLPVGIIILLLI